GVMAWIVDQPARTVVNLTVPALPMSEVKGVRRAALAPFGTVRTAIAEQREGRIQLELRDTGVKLDPSTDTAMIGEGYASVTPLVGIRADESVDVSVIVDLADSYWVEGGVGRR